MNAQDVAVLARLFREAYSWEALDSIATEPSQGNEPERVVAREQMWEPLRSFKLIDAVGMGPILVVTFTWADGADDDTVYLMPLDMRAVPVDMSDPITVDTFLSHHLEWTLGGPRETWVDRTTLLGPNLSLVRPYHAP